MFIPLATPPMFDIIHTHLAPSYPWGGHLIRLLNCPPCFLFCFTFRTLVTSITLQVPPNHPRLGPKVLGRGYLLLTKYRFFRNRLTTSQATWWIFEMPMAFNWVQRYEHEYSAAHLANSRSYCLYKDMDTLPNESSQTAQYLQPWWFPSWMLSSLPWLLVVFWPRGLWQLLLAPANGSIVSTIEM